MQGVCVVVDSLVTQQGVCVVIDSLVTQQGVCVVIDSLGTQQGVCVVIDSLVTQQGVCVVIDSLVTQQGVCVVIDSLVTQQGVCVVIDSLVTEPEFLSLFKAGMLCRVWGTFRVISMALCFLWRYVNRIIEEHSGVIWEKRVHFTHYLLHCVGCFAGDNIVISAVTGATKREEVCDWSRKHVF